MYCLTIPIKVFVQFELMGMLNWKAAYISKRQPEVDSELILNTKLYNNKY